jgi:hypothetical protein
MTSDDQGGGVRPFTDKADSFAGGVTQIDRAPLKGVPQPPKCPRYGDEWAQVAFNPKSIPAGTFKKGRT